ncbi:MAG TPA: hypothetical protein VFQ65_08450, partial [Kofleriaceae bacterium]|nr:hypothetical protein [Kofleriaceae bacterium]
MGGCTNCKGKSGCDDRKGSMMQSVDDALEQLYPSHTWGEAEEPRDPNHAGMPADELDALAEELATELRAATFVRPGGDDEPCDFIYVLALGRAPCIVQVRDHGVAVPEEWGDAVEEMYLRVVVSQRARVAAVQQVAVTAVRDGEHWLVRESPRAGVYDAPLLARMQKLVAILPAYDVLHVDFGEIAHAPPGFHAGTWQQLFGGEPSIANYLFYPQPTTMITTSVIG